MKSIIKSSVVVLGAVGALSFTSLAANAATLQTAPSASATTAIAPHPLGCGGPGGQSCN